VAALGVSGALLLAACGGSEVGAAAVINGERVSVSMLQDTTESLVEAGGGAGAPGAQAPAADVQQTTLRHFIVNAVVEQAAEQQGVTVTQGDIDALATQIRSQFGDDPAQMEQALVTQFGVAPSFIDEFIRQQALLEALGRKMVPGEDEAIQQERSATVETFLFETASDLDVEVNPRYGVWDPAQVSVLPQVSGGLARTAEQWANPTPAPTPGE
jgi:hypothetical protein